MTAATPQPRLGVPKLNMEGRSITSALDIESTRDEAGRYVELSLTTSHQAGRGYSATITRTLVDGISRKISLGFGGESDIRSVDTSEHAPASSRLNRTQLMRLHRALTEDLNASIASWITWAEQHTQLR